MTIQKQDYKMQKQVEEKIERARHATKLLATELD